MSKTSIKERNKAIRLAWEREQQLVQEGKGTRDWTKEQQKDILDKGKAYDEKERAFEGQHMKSAAEYPEYQGDLDNIQFLTREEHLEAHKGSWQNSTNWYYNPETKEFIDFGDNKYVPCEIVDLTDPVAGMTEAVQVFSEMTESIRKRNKEKDSGNEQRRGTPLPINPNASVPLAVKPSPKTSKSFGEKMMDVVEAVKGFSERHPVLTGVVVGVAAVAVRTEAIANSGKGSGGGSRSSSDDYDDTSFGREYPDERSSPKGHIVLAHGQHYHTKDGVIWKKKESYTRGGRYDDD